MEKVMGKSLLGEGWHVGCWLFIVPKLLGRSPVTSQKASHLIVIAEKVKVEQPIE
jgi:hypothetical protein